MPSRNSPAPSPLALHKPKSLRSLKSFFTKSSTPASPISPPATPVSFTSTISTADSLKTVQRPLTAGYPIYHHGAPALPQVVYDNIIFQLVKMHGEANNGPCDTCFMRDVGALMLVGKAWNRGFANHLYTKIYLHGPDSQTQLKRRFGLKSNHSYGGRIKLLSRTLQSRPDLASMVKELKVPAYDMRMSREDATYIHAIVANLVMECPNLEKLLGFYPTYEYSCSNEDDDIESRSPYRWGGGDKLWQALSTRMHLKEHVWLLSGDVLNQDDLNISNGVGQYYDPHAQEKQLPQSIIEKFIWYHRNWSSLETLVLHGLTSTPNLSPHHFDALFSCTPSLVSLYVSHFHPHQFNNDNLFTLPPSLTALRLESLPGLTDGGLSKFFSNPNHLLERLSLINVEIQSLLIIIKLFANLSRLDTFTFLQNCSPVMPEGEVIFLSPLMASSVVDFIHWDCLEPGESETYLASSIQEGGFPCLSRLRAPSDPGGILQSVCRPRERIELPGDKFRSLIVKQTPQRSKQAAAGYQPTSPDLCGGMSPPFSPTSIAGTTTTTTSSSSNNNNNTPNNVVGFSRHLPTARTSAQSRLELARHPLYSFPSKIAEMTQTSYSELSIPAFQMKIVVTNCDVPEDTRKAQECVTVVGYLGCMRSKVDYWLVPDLPGSESAIVGVGDIIDLGWEWRENGAGSEYCTGLMNMREGVNAGAGGGHSKKYWLHTERVPWKKVPLDILFG